MAATKTATTNAQPEADEPYKEVILLGKDVRYFPGKPGWVYVDGEWVEGVPAMMIRLTCVALTADRLSMVESLTEAREELAKARERIARASERWGSMSRDELDQCGRIAAVITKIDMLGQA